MTSKNEHISKISRNAIFVKQSLKPKKASIQHMTTVHEGNKPFNCAVCNTYWVYNFISHEPDLKRHTVVVHEGKKHFKCDKFTI